MKKVVSPSEVSHFWANQTQDEANNSGNTFYFRGKNIYSYGSHFCIAKHETNEQGQSIVLFTTRSYSNTTCKHIKKVQNASNHLNKIYCPYPDSNTYQNLEWWQKSAESIAANLPKSKKPEIYLNKIEALKKQAVKYLEFFGLNENSFPAFFLSLNIGSKDEYSQYNDKKQAAQLEQEKRQAKERAANHKKELKEWVNFERATLYNRNGFDYLRFNTEAQRVETSQGVQIPVETAQKFYNWLLLTIKNGGCNGNCGIKILHYDVNNVTEKEFKIGCHTIEMKEAKKIATLLGW